MMFADVGDFLKSLAGTGICFKSKVYVGREAMYCYYFCAQSGDLLVLKCAFSKHNYGGFLGLEGEKVKSFREFAVGRIAVSETVLDTLFNEALEMAKALIRKSLNVSPIDNIEGEVDVRN